MWLDRPGIVPELLLTTSRGEGGDPEQYAQVLDALAWFNESIDHFRRIALATNPHYKMPIKACGIEPAVRLTTAVVNQMRHVTKEVDGPLLPFIVNNIAK